MILRCLGERSEVSALLAKKILPGDPIFFPTQNSDFLIFFPDIQGSPLWFLESSHYSSPPVRDVYSPRCPNIFPHPKLWFPNILPRYLRVPPLVPQKFPLSPPLDLSFGENIHPWKSESFFMKHPVYMRNPLALTMFQMQLSMPQLRFSAHWQLWLFQLLLLFVLFAC